MTCSCNMVCVRVCAQWANEMEEISTPSISHVTRAHENTTISYPPGGSHGFVCTCLLHWAPMQPTHPHTRFLTFPPSPPQAINGAYTAYLIMPHITLVWRKHTVHREHPGFPQDPFVCCGCATLHWYHLPNCWRRVVQVVEGRLEGKHTSWYQLQQCEISPDVQNSDNVELILQREVFLLTLLLCCVSDEDKATWWSVQRGNGNQRKRNKGTRHFHSLSFHRANFTSLGMVAADCC